MFCLRHAIRLSAVVFLLSAGTYAYAAEESKPFVPYEGQAGKDVVWVPTPFVLVEKMLDLAKVTAKDFVMDLGSGDGRNIIAAAKRATSAAMPRSGSGSASALCSSASRIASVAMGSRRALSPMGRWRSGSVQPAP